MAFTYLIISISCPRLAAIVKIQDRIEEVKDVHYLCFHFEDSAVSGLAAGEKNYNNIHRFDRSSF